MTEPEYYRKALDFEEIKGMKVKDKNNEILGEVSSVEINPVNLEVEGIVLKRGLFKTDILIGREYIDGIGRKYIHLNDEFVMNLVGKKVVKEGEEIGEVSDLKRKGKENSLTHLVVKMKENGEKHIDKDEIKDVRGEKVYLK